MDGRGPAGDSIFWKTPRLLKIVMPETSRHEPPAETGFTMIELLVVIAIILIVASFALPAYNRIVTRSHEVVLRDDLFTLRQMINRYTLDNHKPPDSLQELVKSGYFEGGLPIDPFTGSSQTWQPDIEDVSISPEETRTARTAVRALAPGNIY